MTPDEKRARAEARAADRADAKELGFIRIGRRTFVAVDAVCPDCGERLGHAPSTRCRPPPPEMSDAEIADLCAELELEQRLGPALEAAQAATDLRIRRRMGR